VIGSSNRSIFRRLRQDWRGPLIALLLLVFYVQSRVHAQDWKSGQGSPVHDSDRLYSLGTRSIVIENDRLSLSFDESTGALIGLVNKVTGWRWQVKASLGESFNLFVPTPDRSYSPVLGVRNRLSSFQRSANGQSLTLVWSDLESEYQGKLDITLRGTVQLEGDRARFEITVMNHSPHTIASLSWPIVGSIAEPDPVMQLSTPTYGGMSVSPLWNPALPNGGYFGTNYPARLVNGRYILVSTPEQGLYVGAHNPDAKENVKFLFEVKPGFSDALHNRNPKSASISRHPVRLTLQVEHYPFLKSGEQAALAPIVLATYSGDWHAGADIYRRWLSAWYHPLPMPAWAEDIHAWQQLQIDSSEDDLRTKYVDLPQRVADDVKHGITTLQLVGWNRGGQDRDNPSNNTDPRLGTDAELKDAIARIQNMGIHVVLFAKYAWADTSTEWYRSELHKHMATDPYGDNYTWEGYRYQTPEQLAGINTRHFATGCTSDAAWRKILGLEFQKVIDLGADGVLFDEAQHKHSSDYNLCFNPDHGHPVPATIWSGDIKLADLYRGMVRNTVGEKNFLFSGEDPEDVISGAYSLSYFRIGPGHIPEERYVHPFRPLMIAVLGFDDRETINRALMYRYILSYEPFNFKGDIGDFPLTMAYGEKMDVLRRRYRDYLWDAEFRDTLGAKVEVSGAPYKDYAIFMTRGGRRAVIVTNDKASDPIQANVTLDPGAHGALTCSSPERPEARPCGLSVTVPARSTVVLMEH
jgi:hypothetical protein